jgi:DNA-binding HxlR family transcriptional regulator
MDRKLPRTDQCPLARSLNRVGEWWSMLILRESFYGAKRFDEFQKNLDIATNMLSSRLASLVEEGLLERSQYCDKPPRFEYLLTQRGFDFRPVMLALVDWSNKNFAPEGISAQVVDRETQRPVDLMLVDRNTGKQITIAGHALVPGPAASESMRQRLLRAVTPDSATALIPSEKPIDGPISEPISEPETERPLSSKRSAKR